MSEEDKKVKLIFQPGCFDDFEGTQEELDEMIAEVQRMADTGELFENAVLVDDLDLEDLDEDFQVVVDKIIDPDGRKKRLH